MDERARAGMSPDEKEEHYCLVRLCPDATRAGVSRLRRIVALAAETAALSSTLTEAETSQLDEDIRAKFLPAIHASRKYQDRFDGVDVKDSLLLVSREDAQAAAGVWYWLNDESMNRLWKSGSEERLLADVRQFTDSQRLGLNYLQDDQDHPALAAFAKLLLLLSEK